ncbi:MAG TPA: DUF4157 domain-containing protein [Pyrinomonadaceae bacterium]|nr:DUF4157 domain-containing protein [Pyrinomonadaceae bacterium]
MKALVAKLTASEVQLRHRRNAAKQFPRSPRLSSSFAETATPMQLDAWCACGGGCPHCAVQSHVEQPLPLQSALSSRNVAAGGSVRVERVRTISGELASQPITQLRHSIARESGQPLPPALQQNWGARLRRDLSALRVHNDGPVTQAVSSSGANAMNYGHHLFFALGSYAPHSLVGLRLLGHEVAHALQSDMQAAPDHTRMPSPAGESQLEAEADRAGVMLAERAPLPVQVSPPAHPLALRGDKQIRFSDHTITVTDTYVIYGDAASFSFLQRFARALNTYYNSPTFTYRGFNVRFNLSVRQARYATRTRRDREGFEYPYQVMLDSNFDSDTKLFEVARGTGRAGGISEVTLYETSGEATIAHEVGHYLSDRVGYFSERYSEGFWSRLGVGQTVTTPDPGCEHDIMATLSGSVTNCALSDFLDAAINAHGP